MSEKKTNSVINFIKKNLYYILIGLSLIIIATVIAIVLATNSAPVDEGKVPPVSDSEQNSESTPNQDQTQKPIEKPDDTPTNNPNDNPSDDTPNTPVDTKIVFNMPIAETSVLKDYTSSTVVYNQTLGVYTGHMGIDFGAEKGAEVMAAYGGTIESVTTSYLQGTTVVIDHGNGLKSIYNSIDALENLAEGQSVSAGQVIGTVSDNNRQEYKDGPHLHFEVTLNGQKVDPDQYLMMNEK
ncbi:MAG: M23 family metallopeptidase [Clostridia bacterium]|nr:M23 family metallopeptidase [Clostridia bacterium]